MANSLPFNVCRRRRLEDDAGRGGDELAGLLAAPVEFKRMLSWQLSTPSIAPVAKRIRRRTETLRAKELLALL